MIKTLIIICIIMVIVNCVLVAIDFSKGIKKEDKFICKYCGSTFLSYDFLLIHFKNNHFDEIEKEAKNI